MYQFPFVLKKLKMSLYVPQVLGMSQYFYSFLRLSFDDDMMMITSIDLTFHCVIMIGEYRLMDNGTVLECEGI